MAYGNNTKERAFELANEVSALVRDHEVAVGALEQIEIAMNELETQGGAADCLEDLSRNISAFNRIRTAISLWNGFKGE